MNITPTFARTFARDWVQAWNAHDLPRVLEHYTEDFEMTSPFIVQLAGEPSGRLKGKSQVAAYWKKALARHPDLQFELLQVLTGPSSVVVLYHRWDGLSAAEVFFFNRQGLVERAAAHYDDQSSGATIPA